MKKSKTLIEKTEKKKEKGHVKVILFFSIYIPLVILYQKTKFFGFLGRHGLELIPDVWQVRVVCLFRADLFESLQSV